MVYFRLGLLRGIGVETIQVVALAICTEIAIDNSIGVDYGYDIENELFEECFSCVIFLKEVLDKSVKNMTGGYLSRMHSCADEYPLY
jgi:hypothetical protein